MQLGMKPAAVSMRAIVLALAMTTVAAQAADVPARVLLLQAPAWLERNGQRAPLTARTQLANGDRIVTGDAARAVLRLAEGSIVKLGADATLALDDMKVPETESDVFEGLLDVLKGAFRFTTQLADRKRNVRARVGTATIGIRGTDVWGKNERERDFVVLLEGAIEIERDGQTTSVTEPLSLYMAPTGQAAEPVAPVDPDDLAVWAQETEPQEGAGLISESGLVVLQLASYTARTSAEAMQTRLATDGYATDITGATVAGNQWWRLALPGFDSRDDALAVAARLTRIYGFTSPWLAASE